MVEDKAAHAQASSAASTELDLELALDVAGIGRWRFDFADHRIRYDARALEILARTMGPEGEPLETVRGWIHPDDRADVARAFDEAIAQGRPVDTQTRYLHANGSWRTILTRRVLQRDSAGRPQALVGVGIDITEQQHRTLEALRLAQRLENAAEAARVGLWSGAVDELPQWSDRMYALLKRDRVEGPMTLGELLREYAHPQDRDRVAKAAVAWIHGPVDAPLDLVLRIVLPGGELRWVEVRSRQEPSESGARRAFGVLLDVTEQHQALERAREAHERNALALSSVGMGTWTHDVQTGIDTWDAQMYHLRGLPVAARAPSAEERMALVVPEDRAQVEAASMPYLTSTVPLAYEFRIRRADGEIRIIAARSIALTDASGRIERRIGVNWDVTETRQAEHAWRDREISLRESRNRAALFSRVSHELRTPLNAVLGFTQLLLADDTSVPAAQRQRWLTQVHAAGASLLALVDGVLELNELTDPGAEGACLQPLPLAAAIEAAVSAAAPDATHRQVQLDHDVAACVVQADALRLERLLSRLLVHALQRSRAGGAVTLRCSSDAGMAVVSITDAGAPIVSAEADALFEAFGSDAEAPGALGLALARAQASSLGGTLQLAHSDARRTTLELRLPMAPAADARPARVLYIEDNAVNMLIVRELLAQRPGIEFHGAADGTEGLALARSLEPALVLIDMQLPDMDGLEVLRRLRGDPATAALPCVALSANAMPEDVQKARDAGFDDYWTKPIDLAAFLREIDRRVTTRL